LSQALVHVSQHQFGVPHTVDQLLYREAASKRPAMLGALRRSAKEASKTLGRASQLQQQRFLNIHEYQVIADRHVAALHLGVDFWLQFRLTGGQCYCRVQN